MYLLEAKMFTSAEMVYFMSYIRIQVRKITRFFVREIAREKMWTVGPIFFGTQIYCSDFQTIAKIQKLKTKRISELKETN